MIRTTRRSRVVYFARRADGTGPIKIGNTYAPNQRIRELNLICDSELHLLAYAPGGFTTETAVHLKFAATRLYGEWFAATDDLLEFIAQAKTTGRLPLREDERRDQVFARRYLAGETYQQIADDYGITRERVRQVLRSHGVPAIGLRTRRAALPCAALGGATAAPGSAPLLPMET